MTIRDLKIGPWADDAICKGETARMYVTDMHQAERNTALCDLCPVKTECGDWAIVRHERYGIWGGMTEQEREKAWRRRQRARTAQRKRELQGAQTLL